MSQSCSLVRHGSTLHGGDLPHKTNVVRGIDRRRTCVVYARARTYIH
nr:MAG TPA: hypothetical protein [Caudoviricetes sp.]